MFTKKSGKICTVGGGEGGEAGVRYEKQRRRERQREIKEEKKNEGRNKLQDRKELERALEAQWHNIENPPIHVHNIYLETNMEGERA